MFYSPANDLWTLQSVRLMNIHEWVWSSEILLQRMPVTMVPTPEFFKKLGAWKEQGGRVSGGSTEPVQIHRYTMHHIYPTQ